MLIRVRLNNMSDNVVRDALGRFFDGFDAIADQDLPSLPIPDGATPEIFVGDANDEGWVKWRPMVKTEVFDLSELERNAKFEVHASVKQYLNAWWFGYLNVQFRQYHFEIDPIIPGNYKAAFLQQLLGYRRAHESRIDYIPIGMEVERGLLLVVRNSSGEVCVEDYEAGSYEVLCKSLPAFFDICSGKPD